MNMEQIARSTLAIVRATDLDDLPTDGSETLDLAMRHTVLWQGAEIERLQAIVGKLPKTADGVSVVPEIDIVYVLDNYGEIQETSCYHDGHQWVIDVVVDHHKRSSESWPIEMSYSTREAAEAGGK